MRSIHFLEISVIMNINSLTVVRAAKRWRHQCACQLFPLLSDRCALRAQHGEGAVVPPAADTR